MKPGTIKAMVVVAGALVGLAYWAAAFLLYPDEPFYLKVVFRLGDLQYFPLIESLARLDLSPTYSAVFSGSGLVRFPLPPLIPHAVGFALAGPAGLMAADVVVVAVAGYAFYWLFRVASASRQWAAVLALICISTYFVLPTHGMVYGLRLPRPEVTNLFIVGFLGYLLLWIRRPGRLLKRGWRIVAFGALTALVLQGSVYFFLIGVTLLAAAVAESLLSWRVLLDRRLGRAALLFVAAFLVVGLPFAVQALWGAPDLATRFGLYPAEQRAAVVATFFRPLLAAMGPPCIAAAAILVLLRLRGRSTRLAAALLSFPLLAGGAALIFFLLSPAYVQLFHFPDSVADTGRFVLMLLLAQLGRLGLPSLPRRWSGPATAAALLASVALIFGWQLHSLPHHKVTGSANTFAAERQRLRDDVATLIQRFGAAPGGAPRQLLTNDHHLLTWWVMAGQGTLLMPDVFEVVLTDQQIETQLVQVGKYLGWSGATWSGYINQDRLMPHHVHNSVLLYFHSHAKYQASSLHSRAPPADYPARLRPVIARARSTWSLALPFSARQRLDTAYAATGRDPRFAPDLIVWGKYRGTPAASPPAEYHRVLDLPNYTVWQRQAGLGEQTPIPLP
ncbi:hypothetical protein [Endothiovibrio diazotrophicus]